MHDLGSAKLLVRHIFELRYARSNYHRPRGLSLRYNQVDQLEVIKMLEAELAIYVTFA